MNVLITGASSGIGEAVALASAERGDRLFLCGRDRSRLDAVAEACRARGATVRADVVDVADELAMREWMESCDSDAPLGRVFANAGIATFVEDEENVRRTFATNVGGVLNTVLPAIDVFTHPGDAARSPRQIVITASIAGYGPLRACPAYSATKACVKTWGLSLRARLRRSGIGVSVVCPGFVRSRLTARNKCPMPFLMDADRAARIIIRRVDRGDALIAFPWPMRLAAWAAGSMPQWINALVNMVLPDRFPEDGARRARR